MSSKFIGGIPVKDKSEEERIGREKFGIQCRYDTYKRKRERKENLTRRVSNSSAILSFS